MIKIEIKANGSKVMHGLKADKTTLLENCTVLRRLEEIKMELLAMEYESDVEVIEDPDDDDLDNYY